MPLNKGKHNIVEIEGTRCTLVEADASAERCKFLTDLLKFNKLEVKVQENAKKADTDPTTFTVAVTDIIFNPIIAVYQKRLRRADGGVVTPNYWNQVKEFDRIPYWTVNLVYKENYIK